jgi:photosystem II stability/assembly factor-like uncharacterized protein
MLRSLSIAATVTGLATVVSIACSEAFESPPAISRTPVQAPSSEGPTITPQVSGTGERLIAVSPVSSRVVWASGAKGTYVLTTDGGQTWRARQVPGAEALQFRDVEGVSARVAYLLSIGSGQESRIYKTEDGGNTWTLQFQNPNPDAFYDCFAFWSSSRGLTFSDAADGRFPVIKTTNGRQWQDIGDQLPPAQAGEGGFASSGTCVATHGERQAWIGTGAAKEARILASTDGGNTWSSSPTPIRQGTPTSGVASVAFRDRFHGILGGGDVADNATRQDNVARTADGGKTWTLTTPTPFAGAVYGLSYVPGQRQTVVATGPSGAAWTSNEGDTWSLLPGVLDCWSAAFAGPTAGWLVCGAGQILKVSFENDGPSDDGDGDSNRESSIGR